MVEASLEWVTDQVVRIPLPIPLEGLRHINSYALLGGSGVLLVDPGWASRESEQRLIQALAELGYGLRDVQLTLATHSHWDHCSQAAKWQRELDIPMAMGAAERRSLEAWPNPPTFYRSQVDLLISAGAHNLAAEVVKIEMRPYEREVVVDTAQRWLADGDQIQCGDMSLVTLGTPGHTIGHVAFEHPQQGLLFSGDHILPHITPTLGCEQVRNYLPLRAYLDSLRLCLSRPDHRMLPAHGPVTDEVGRRINELLTHHEQRLAGIHDLVSAGAQTALAVATRMRWRGSRCEIADLTIEHQVAAVLEVVAHLELLVAQGVLRATDNESGRLYDVA